MNTVQNPMTKERLKQYKIIKIEISELEYRLEHLGEEDSMFGNSVIMDYRGGYPKPQSVVGYDYKKEARMRDRYKKRIKKLSEECKAIEQFVEQIEPVRTRYIFQLTFIEGINQAEVGQRVHLERSSISKEIDKYLKVSHKSQNSHV